MTTETTPHEAARYRIRVAQAWMNATTKNNFEYHVPLKEAAQGLVILANEATEDRLLADIGIAIARAVDEGKDTIRVMKMQWEPMRDACYNAARSYQCMVGYFPDVEKVAAT